MRNEGEFLRFEEGFVLSHSKLSAILKNLQELMGFWSLPIEPFHWYRIEPSNAQWRINGLLGWKLAVILSNATQVNELLGPRYRLNASLVKRGVLLAGEILSSSVPASGIEARPPLYGWQAEALEIWDREEGQRGLVEAATGTGKTRLALECIGKFFIQHPRGVACVLVPRQPLFDQWQEELREHFGAIPDQEYARRGNGHDDGIGENTQIVICTQQTAVLNADARYGCTLIRDLDRPGRDVLIVVDEAHHLGADKTFDRLVKHIPRRFCTLGLTATPMRRDGRMERVYRYFQHPESDAPIYSYPLAVAVDDRVLAQVTQINLIVSLTDEESASYQNMSADINECKKSILDSNAIEYGIYVNGSEVRQGNISYLVELERSVLESLRANGSRELERLLAAIRRLSGLYVGRRRLFNKAAAKWRFLTFLLSSKEGSSLFHGGRWIFFHQEIEECVQTANLLKSSGVPVRLHHSDMSPQERDQALLEFEKSPSCCLCAVQTLDEGIDIPDLAGVVIVSGSTSKRQQIQRCGRALRRASGKDRAYLISLLAQADRDLAGEKLIIGPEKETPKWHIVNIDTTSES